MADPPEAAAPGSQPHELPGRACDRDWTHRSPVSGGNGAQAPAGGAGGPNGASGLSNLICTGRGQRQRRRTAGALAFAAIAPPGESTRRARARAVVPSNGSRAGSGHRDVAFGKAGRKRWPASEGKARSAARGVPRGATTPPSDGQLRAMASRRSDGATADRPHAPVGCSFPRTAQPCIRSVTGLSSTGYRRHVAGVGPDAMSPRGKLVVVLTRVVRLLAVREPTSDASHRKIARVPSAARICSPRRLVRYQALGAVLLVLGQGWEGARTPRPGDPDTSKGVVMTDTRNTKDLGGGAS